MKTIIILMLVIAFIFCLISCGRTQVKNKSLADNAKENISMEDIWNLTDTNDFIIALVEHLNEKTQCGDDMSILSEAERIFYITQALEMEVNSGGFSQFFYNSGGNFSNEVVSAFTAIGANATAEICQKAIETFGRDIPIDRDERIEMLNQFDSDELDEILERYDEEFYVYEDDLNLLNYEFVMKNKEQFT